MPQIYIKYLILTVPKFLIVAATPFETEGFARHFNFPVAAGPGLMTTSTGPFANISLLITGVGMVNTAYALGQCPNDFDYVINAGVCGAFNRSIALGEVLHVVRDTLSEMGAQSDADFIAYHDLGLGGTNVYHETLTTHLPGVMGLRPVTGITVNTVHGNEAAIEKAHAYFNADVESMEGAAFFRACAHFNGSCIQLRAVSNYVEKRDKSKWNMPLAISNLNNFLIQFINDLNA
jgi:futalosine hydrolase